MSQIELPLVIQSATPSEVEALRRLSNALDITDSKQLASALGMTTSDLSEVRSAMCKVDSAGADFRKCLKNIREVQEDRQQSLFSVPQCAAV